MFLMICQFVGGRSGPNCDTFCHVPVSRAGIINQEKMIYRRTVVFWFQNGELHRPEVDDSRAYEPGVFNFAGNAYENHF